MPAQSYSLTQAAALLGLHRNTLAGWLTSKGCPAIRRADKKQGIDWELSLPAIFEWHGEHLAAEAVAGYQDEDGRISKDEADRRRAVALAIVAEAEAATTLRSTVLVADAQACMADFCQVLRSSVDNAVQRIAGRTAMMSDPNEVRDACEKEINRAFEIARDELDRLWGDVKAGREASQEDGSDW